MRTSQSNDSRKASHYSYDARIDRSRRLALLARDCIALSPSEQSEGSDEREPHSDSSKRDEGGRASSGAARKSGGSKDLEKRVRFQALYFSGSCL